MWTYNTWLSNTFIFFIYLFYLEISPIIAYLYSWFCVHSGVNYIWSELCLNFAGCTIKFLEKNHALACYEQNGCLFLSVNNEDLYTNAITTYLTGGEALALTPYSYLTKWAHACNIINETIIASPIFTEKKDLFNNAVDIEADLDKEVEDIYKTLSKFGYNNLIVCPSMKANAMGKAKTLAKAKRTSLYLRLAWRKQMSVQILHIQKRKAILDLKQFKVNYGVNVYCYRSEVIRPKYFNTFIEFAEYTKLIWQDTLLISEANKKV